MTGSIRKNKPPIEIYIGKQLRARTLIRRLTKAVIICAAAAMILSFFLAATKALPIFYTVSRSTVTVSSGDTLWDIAKDNIGEYPGGIRSYLAEIRRINGLSPTDTLVVGAELTLPIYRYKLG